MENSAQKMKVCVLGAGFTGVLAAVAVKSHCSDFEVVLVDPGNEMQMPGLGLSMPPYTVQHINYLLGSNADTASALMARIMSETNSTIKMNLKWKNFCATQDNGWYAGVPPLPSADIVMLAAHHTQALTYQVHKPGLDQYQLPDLWYELFSAGRRGKYDLGPELNHWYYFCETHRVPDNKHLKHSPNETFHANSWDLGNWIKKNYGHIVDRTYNIDVKSVEIDTLGNIQKVNLKDDTDIQADFFIDCTGFRRLLGRAVQADFVKPPGYVFHNAAVVVGQGYSSNIVEEMQPYTIGYGMDYGWTFCIPMKHAKSYGYNFSTEFVSPDAVLAELETLAPAHNRVHDPVTLKWDPGYYPHSMSNNYAMVGITAGFTDPFEANSVGLQIAQIRQLLLYFKNQDNKIAHTKTFNEIGKKVFEGLTERLDFHMCLAPRETSEYWRHNHALAQQHDMVNKIFDVINDPCHYEPARDNNTFKPYQAQCYLTESVYFDLDMSRRCRNSSPDMLNLADDYFASFRRLNQQRAKLAMPMSDYYGQYGVDLQQLITIK